MFRFKYKYAWKAEWKSRWDLNHYDRTASGYSRTEEGAERNAWAAANKERKLGAQKCTIEVIRLY